MKQSKMNKTNQRFEINVNKTRNEIYIYTENLNKIFLNSIVSFKSTI